MAISPATNTTVTRPFEHPLAKEAGGLSGAPVRELANAVIRRAWQRSGASEAVGLLKTQRRSHSRCTLRSWSECISPAILLQRAH